MIKRQIEIELISAVKEYPVVTILGPRQSGKTTLARMTYPDVPCFTLESPDVRLAAQKDPRSFLIRCRKEEFYLQHTSFQPKPGLALCKNPDRYFKRTADSKKH